MKAVQEREVNFLVRAMRFASWIALAWWCALMPLKLTHMDITGDEWASGGFLSVFIGTSTAFTLRWMALLLLYLQSIAKGEGQK